MKPIIERLKAKVDFDHPSGCWLWLGSKGPGGYGRLSRGRVGEGQAMAHRAMWEHEVGPIPDGMELHHECLTPACVNPAHLRPVTPLENKRMIRGRNANTDKTRCVNGHEFTPENTYRRPKGGRSCKACQTERCRRYESARTRVRTLREEAS